MISSAEYTVSFTHLLIADIDGTLTGDDASLRQLNTYLSENRDWLGFGVATGRNINSAMDILTEKSLPDPDIAITSVGTEIFIKQQNERKGLQQDISWSDHISSGWDPSSINRALKGVSCISLQKCLSAQRDYKISYDFDRYYDAGDSMNDVHALLAEQKLEYTLVFSHGSYLDILPARASKGKAVSYAARQYGIPADRIFTAGNSGNDYDMLDAGFNGIVVANYEDDLDLLRNSSRIYFAEESFAGGILEGIRHFLDES